LYTQPPGISEHEMRANPFEINMKALCTQPPGISEHEVRANPWEIILKALGWDFGLFYISLQPYIML
jgi:hypothetical protein